MITFAAMMDIIVFCLAIVVGMWLRWWTYNHHFPE